ncbi:DUF6702 family protein [Microbulbifer hydrolyticus]|uniref:Uncharacterized protein n=1 Tax=Microbulbifer hydrolyticus TaxID=48074 RepID=A0A6P1TGF2_9GAMM|nr:DUF6702 family protein [Microbulbifer hydrolyticus]MBB5210867.1 hypothetical protein [Microbulbifer hydrolyticus]QHQ40756.1 hypothetical protein GTQ55_06685 [Microbulbifer hydrolyticus]
MHSARIYSFLLLVLLALLGSQAHAHRYHFGLTELSVNERTQSLEIAHRFFVADVERALSLSAGEEMQDARKQMEAYVNQHFQMRSESGALVKPRWVGMESDVHDVWIYQEVPLTAVQGKSFKVRQTMLMEVERDQVNTLNLTRDGDTQSYTLKPGSSVVEIEL